MKTSVYLAFCDPEFSLSADDLRIRLALHTLLFEKPTIQDNFLLSEYLWRLNRNDGLVSKLISLDIVQVALRSNAQGSLVEVNRDTVARTKAGLYRPFRGDSLVLYESRDFRNYAQDLDKACKSLSGVIGWDPILHGSMYRAKMLESAMVAPGEWDLSLEDAAEVFDAVERARPGHVHSRTTYFEVADKYFGSDVSKNDAIKKWARAVYLTNIPDHAGLSMSLPVEALTAPTSTRARDLAWLATEVAATEADEDLQNFFNPHFLANVPAEAIHEFRRHPSFKPLQAALSGGDHEAARLHFLIFARNVGKEAPSFVPSAQSDLKRYGKHIVAKKTIAASAPGVWMISAAAFLSGVGLPVAIGGAVIGTLAKILGETKGSEALVERTIAEARASLVQSRFRGSIFSLVDVVDRGR